MPVYFESMVWLRRRLKPVSISSYLLARDNVVRDVANSDISDVLHGVKPV